MPAGPETPHVPAIEDGQLAPFFDHLLGRFHDAAARLGESRHGLTVANRPVHVRLAGSPLVSLMRPLAHLADAPADPPSPHAPLEIFAFESAASGVFPNPPPWSFQQATHRGEIHGLASDEFAVNFTPEPCLLCLFHKPSRKAIYWLPDATRLPYWETAAPFRILLHWWATTFGGQVAHSAAVGKDGRGVLLVGRGGSGKSTTSLLAVDAGLDYAGDDYVLLTQEPHPIAHSLYHTAKMHTAFLRAVLPHWHERVAYETGPQQKSLFFLHECCGTQVRRKLRIQSVLMPMITSRTDAHLEPRPSSLALLAAAPSTMFQFPDARRSTLSFFSRWTGRLPAYALQLGTNVRSAPEQIKSLFSRQGANRAA